MTVSVGRDRLPRRLLSPHVRQVVAVMAADLDRERSMREMSEEAALPGKIIQSVLRMLLRRGLAQATGRRSRRYLLTADGLYLHILHEQHHEEVGRPWPPPTAAGHQRLDLPVVDPDRLTLFTPSMRRLVSVLAANLDPGLTTRELSDNSDVTLATTTERVTHLTRAGLVLTDHRHRPNRHRLTATGLYLFTLAHQRPARLTSASARGTFSPWHPPDPVDPADIDTLAVDRLRRWLARHDGEATRSHIQQCRVAGAGTRTDIDRLLAHYQHLYPGTVLTRTIGRRPGTLIVRAPESDPAAPPPREATTTPPATSDRGARTAEAELPDGARP